jgi:hypothetical protein
MVRSRERECVFLSLAMASSREKVMVARGRSCAAANPLSGARPPVGDCVIADWL